MNTTDKDMVEVKEQNKKKVNRVLSAVYNLPSAPTIIFEVTKIIEDPRSSAAQLGQLISKDQGLVTKYWQSQILLYTVFRAAFQQLNSQLLFSVSII